MQVPHLPQMSLFYTALTLPTADNLKDGSITVTHTLPGAAHPETLTVPLKPDTTELSRIEVTLWSVPATAYEMEPYYNDWFSKHFGFEVLLVYLGSSNRSTLGTMAPQPTGWSSWIPNIPGLSSLSPGKDVLTFADVAPYHITSTTSLGDISRRLPDGEEMDMARFRPNIVVSGAPSPFEEDFWGELLYHPANRDPVTMILTHNCGRCKSVNVDYSKGRPGDGPQGQILKLMMKDRRVDKGTKYSPVFGRYGFIGSSLEQNTFFRVGDEVTIAKRNESRSTFDWPGLTN
ncbi:hypothetical protein L228DRAFT_249261 [Xylona heveae TC161]|uniref:MOSC domain-containing protein n=1 Tax=Xylona heveae (strain CBS 132557 / TC161) TaxID=1328760 RepID=A0A165FVS4_XYLHT|nr:hypothetical protein L228DRAFT_249261 [Xylona heveae TC161]KZF21439.1 hypothetical protein L228DRAFT_249261 [Xylona heveae TC161]